MYKCYRLNKFLGVLCLCIIILSALIGFTVKGIRYAAVAETAAVADDIEMVSNSDDKGIFVPVIMYHSLLNDESRQGDYVTRPAQFTEDMEYLKTNGFNTVFISDIAEYVINGTELPDKPVVITFDDGYYNVLHYAYPYLKENNMKAVMNVVGSYTVQATDEDEHNPQYSALTWDEINELSESGVFEIGNHSYDLHSLSYRKGCKKLYSESDEEYRKVLMDDIGRLQGLLEDKSNIKPEIFAYPYGLISDESVEILQDIGFKALLTCYEKPNFITRDPECLMSINRYNRSSEITTEEFMNKLLKQ